MTMDGSACYVGEGHTKSLLREYVSSVGWTGKGDRDGDILGNHEYL